MGANEPRQSLSEIARAEAFKHDQMLLRAVHNCQRVLYQGKYNHIHVLRTGPAGGAIETEVYLTGRPEPVPASEVTLAPDVS
ncbi:hypothetical protein GTP46_24260 [Duganella sp. FT135W]|uniref:Uncharacterized protein n=1 Tax=Duganella flavida TaxID=2692175 RepID=A0A6L8KEC3_9BURK|nr:hypothetical protein [Duganella flavida]MYM25746.1 hypothetical protein [Duganella flavida]